MATPSTGSGGQKAVTRQGHSESKYGSNVAASRKGGTEPVRELSVKAKS